MKLNEEIYTKLKRYSDDIIYDDKYEATLKQWLDSYGANIRSELDEDGAIVVWLHLVLLML